MIRRDLNAALNGSILEAPEQLVEVGPGRMVYQSRVLVGTPAKLYLVRVFVDVERRPREVVTAYRMSKIWKYCKQ